MTPEERIKICSLCTQRKFRSDVGLVCGLTDAKPTFEETCPDYSEDASKMELRKEKEAEKKDGISGLLAFFVYVSIPLGLLLTIANQFTSKNLAALEGNTALILYSIVFLGFYIYFQSYTIYAFIKKKNDAVFIAKFQLIVLAATNILCIVGGDGSSFLDSVPRLIISVAWCIVFFVYLCFSEQVADRIPKETRKLSRLNKALIITAVSLCTILYVCAVLEVALKQQGVSLGKGKLETAISQAAARLPEEVGEGVTWTDIYDEGDYIVMKYTKSFEDASDYTPELSTLVGLTYAESLKAFFDEGSIDDPLYGLVLKKERGLRYVYEDVDGEELYTVSISANDLKEMFRTDNTYSLREDDAQAIIAAFNALLPIEYFADCVLVGCTYESGEVTYNLVLQGFSNADLAYLTNDYMKEYMISLWPYFTDAAKTVAVLGQTDVRYTFSAEGNSWWSKSVVLTPEEYNNITEAE